MNAAGTEGEVSSADIRKELFEGENVRTKDFDKQKENDNNIVVNEKSD